MTNPTNDRSGGMGSASPSKRSASERSGDRSSGNPGNSDTARVARALNALAGCVESLVNESKTGNAKPRQELTEAKRLIGELRDDGGARSQQGAASRGDHGTSGPGTSGSGTSSQGTSDDEQGGRQMQGPSSSITGGQTPLADIDMADDDEEDEDDDEGSSPVRRS